MIKKIGMIVFIAGLVSILAYNGYTEVKTKKVEYLGQGRKYLDQGEYDKAAKVFKEGVNVYPDSDDLNYFLGVAYYQMGFQDLGVTFTEDNFTEAKKYFDKAIELNPMYIDAYNDIGASYNYLGKYKEAISYLEKTIHIDPDYFRGYNNLGMSYVELHQPDKAIPYLEKAIELNPDSYGAYYNLGMCYYFKGNHVKAKENFLRAKSLMDSKRDSRYYRLVNEFLSKVNAAEVKDDSGNNEKVSSCEKALAQDLGNVMLMLDLANAERDKARRVFEDKRNWQEKEGWDSLGSAFKMYKKAAELAKSGDQLGQIYYQWAVALEFNRDYVGVWEKIKLARKHNGSFIEQVFIDKLSKTFPESKAEAGPVSVESLGLEKDLFVTIETNQDNVKVDEKIAVSIRLYVNKLNLFGIRVPVVADGRLIVADFGEPKQFKKEVDEKVYDVLEFKTEVSGTNPGTYKIGPARINCYIIQKDPKEKNKYDTLYLELKSKALEISVK